LCVHPPEIHPMNPKYFLIIMLALLAGCSQAAADRQEPATFRINISSEPPTLDWSLATDSVSFDVVNNIMEGLTQFDKDLHPQPAVAERWEFLDGGRRLLFHLRPGVRWTDGKPVTARDFEYSWKRLLNPAIGAEYAYFLYDLVNARAYNEGKITDSNLVGVRALDDLTLEVRLVAPRAYFPSITTFMVTFPMRRDIVERYGEQWTEPGNIVTLGPFRLQRWQHDYKVTLTRNPTYYGPPPPLGRVEMYVVPEPNTALTLYETGFLEVVNLTPLAIPRYRRHPEYVTAPQLRGNYYGFNVEKKPFHDVRVRKAFAMAVDKSQLTRILQGGEIPTNSWVPKGMFGYNPEIGLRFNPREAQRLLAEAGYPGGKGFPPVKAVFNSDPVNSLIAEFLQGQWRRNLGVSIELDNQEWKVYLQNLKADPPPLFRLGWGADYPDPDNFLNLFVTGGGNNNTKWGNRRYDELIERAGAETNERTRVALYNEAQKILTEEDVPIISLFISAQNMLIKPYVQGYEVNAMDILYLKRVSLANPGKKRPGGTAGS